MKYLKYIFSVVFGLMLLLSCEPGRAENGDFLFGLDPNSGGGDTVSVRLLKRMVSHEFNDDSGEWEDADITYNYEGNKLVSYQDPDGLTSFDYGTNNKISKIRSAGQNSTLIYNGSVLSKISSEIAGVAKINAEYTFAGNKLAKVISVQEYAVPLPMKFYMETTYEFQGENMVKALIKNGMYDDSGVLVMNPNSQTISFTYDAKKSPFKLLPTEFVLYLTGVGPQGAAFLSANNVLTMKSVGDGAPESETYQYEYDVEGYPVKSSFGGEGYVKYEYK